MKKSMIGLSILAVGLLSACQKDDVTTNGGNAKGNTYASLSIKINNPLSRAVNDNQSLPNDQTGTAEENNIGKVDFFSSVVNKQWNWSDFTPNSGLERKSEEFKVSPANNVSMALALNGENLGLSLNPDLVYGGATNTDLLTQIDAVAHVGTQANDSHFLMTSEFLKGQTIKPDVQSGQVTDGNNLFKFEKVERLVSKGIVQTKTALDGNTTDGQGSIEVSSLKYSAVNGATKAYAFGTHAGDHGMSDVATDGVYKYKDFESAIHNITSDRTELEDAEKAVKAGLVRLGVAAGASEGVSKTNDDLGNYKAIPVLENAAFEGQGARKGIYFLENSVKDLASIADFGYYRLASAKVYAKYTPKQYWTLGEIKKVNGDYKFTLKVVESSQQALADGTFVMNENTVFDNKTTALVYLASLGKAEAVTALGELEKQYKNEQNMEAEAFKKIVADYYKKVNDPSAPKTDQFVYTYGNGMCGYYSLWNRQGADKKTCTYADTRRNNVYVLTINSFAKVGFPWDPSDPNDPNLPKPGDDPKPGKIDPNINPKETVMQVSAKVLDWNVVERGVDLN